MTNLPERITIKETSSRFVVDETTFCGTIGGIKKNLDKYEKEGWEGIEYSFIGHNGAVEYNLYKHRLETDKERDKRLTAISQKAKKDAIAKEVRRLRYETLRKEFESE